MVISEVIYFGGLWMLVVYLGFGIVIEIDVFMDNYGKGECFFLIDLVVISYVFCMLFIIGIYCNEYGYLFEYGKVSVIKVMGVGLRRIVKFVLDMDFIGNGWDEVMVEKIICVGKVCLVVKFIYFDIEIELIICIYWYEWWVKRKIFCRF